MPSARATGPLACEAPREHSPGPENQLRHTGLLLFHFCDARRGSLVRLTVSPRPHLSSRPAR